MLQLSLNLPELKEFAKGIPSLKEGLFNLMRIDVKEMATSFVNSVLDAEFEIFLGRSKYERKNAVSRTKRNYRNGFYLRTMAIKGIGKVSIKIPRDRKGEYHNNILPRYQRIENAIKEDVALLYLTGLSTRTMHLLSKRLFGVSLSPAEVSLCSAKLSGAVEKWRSREITESFKYLYLDGTNFPMRIEKSIQKVNVLVVVGVTEDGHKQVLALQAGDRESAPNWRELFVDLKKRGLDKTKVKLGIMDGLPGLEKVFSEEFPKAKIQRCQVHVARNVVSKVPHKIKQAVADDMRSIFYSSTKGKALEFFKQFKNKWSKTIPSALKCLESSLDKTLCFYNFPEEEWLAIRTTNPIERLNKEFKRRTKSMEIVAGETSCYNLLAVISLRMEVYWKKHPITFQKALPWFKSGDEFTQNF